MNRVVIYTAISGDYDDLKEPLIRCEDCDYVCFTDNLDLSSEVWKIIPFEELGLDDVRKAREVKLRPQRYFPDYEYSIWVDSNIELIGDIMGLLKEYFAYEESQSCEGSIGIIPAILESSEAHQQQKEEVLFLSFKHPIRDCAYEEAEACILLKKDVPAIINKQMTRYSEEGFPRNAGLIESNVILRKHNNAVLQGVMENWWHEVENESKRDQLSFNYVCWKLSFEYNIMPGESRGKSDYFLLLWVDINHKQGKQEMERLENELKNLVALNNEENEVEKIDIVEAIELEKFNDEETLVEKEKEEEFSVENGEIKNDTSLC